MKGKMIIFTDLDGTLLDDNYSFDAALSALRLIEEKQIPLVLCSSKTRAEIEYYRDQLNNSHPFISENGGGIFIPEGYFSTAEINTYRKINSGDDYIVISLGTPYQRLRDAVEELRRRGFHVKGFGDMSVEEVSRTTGLSLSEASMAKMRDFDEPFMYYGDTCDKDALFAAIKKMGLQTTEGKIYHILGENDKGKAVSVLTGLYRNKFNNIMTIAIGDSPNDVPMLEKVDICFVVEKSSGGHDERINIPNLVKVQGIGPQGWNRTMQNLILNLQKAFIL